LAPRGDGRGEVKSFSVGTNSVNAKKLTYSPWQIQARPPGGELGQEPRRFMVTP
jgi:hypothetical protein